MVLWESKIRGRPVVAGLRYKDVSFCMYDFLYRNKQEFGPMLMIGLR